MPPHEPASPDASSAASAGPTEGPLSLKRLTAAFAEMLGARPSASSDDDAPAPAGDPCDISPESIVEAVLFVGGANDADPTVCLTAERLASEMRNVTPEEVGAAIEKLNRRYEHDGAPYQIESTPEGYRLGLRNDMRRMRDKFYGRVKETRLTAAALEVLAVVAYKQPVTATRVDQMRGAKSGGLLASLVRRGLLRLDRPEAEGPASYQTTDRFLRLFRINHPNQLPRVAEMDD